MSVIACYTHLTNVYEPSHKRRVAEGADSGLSLISCSVFHDSKNKLASSKRCQVDLAFTHPQPYIPEESYCQPKFHKQPFCQLTSLP